MGPLDDPDNNVLNVAYCFFFRRPVLSEFRLISTMALYGEFRKDSTQNRFHEPVQHSTCAVAVAVSSSGVNRPVVYEIPLDRRATRLPGCCIF